MSSNLKALILTTFACVLFVATVFAAGFVLGQSTCSPDEVLITKLQKIFETRKIWPSDGKREEERKQLISRVKYEATHGACSVITEVTFVDNAFYLEYQGLGVTRVNCFPLYGYNCYKLSWCKNILQGTFK